MQGNTLAGDSVGDSFQKALDSLFKQDLETGKERAKQEASDAGN